MWQNGLKTVLMVKSVMSISFAYEIAAAGQVLAAFGVGTIGVVPYLWRFSRRLVERGEAIR